MSDRINVVVTGNDEVARAMGRLADSTSDLSDPLGSVGERVVAEAQGFAPKLTGALASSVHLERRRTSISVASSLIYSGVQNYGWPARNISPSYFLNRAADTKGDLAADLIAAQITGDIRKAGLT
jgi:hypothetical protein